MSSETDAGIASFMIARQWEQAAQSTLLLWNISLFYTIRESQALIRRSSGVALRDDFASEESFRNRGRGRSKHLSLLLCSRVLSEPKVFRRTVLALSCITVTCLTYHTNVCCTAVACALFSYHIIISCIFFPTTAVLHLRLELSRYDSEKQSDHHHNEDEICPSLPHFVPSELSLAASKIYPTASF